MVLKLVIKPDILERFESEIGSLEEKYLEKKHENFHKIILHNAHSFSWAHFYFYSKIKPSELSFFDNFLEKNPDVRKHEFRHIKKIINLDKLNYPIKVKSKDHTTLQYISLTLMY